MSRRILVAVCLVVGVLAGNLSARAQYPCSWYWVTAPGAGTYSDTKCSPVPMPDPLTQAFTYQRCGGVPPASFHNCTGARVYTP